MDSGGMGGQQTYAWIEMWMDRWINRMPGWMDRGNTLMECY